MDNRTAKDFVRDMYKRGRCADEIRAVATSSRWSSKMDEIERWIKRGERIKNKKAEGKRKIKIKRRK